MSRKFMFLTLCLLLLSGCGQWNIFKWAHKEGTAASSDTTVLVADGQALLDKGDQASLEKAETIFEQAMTANPRSSEANYGYAQAVIAASGLGLANLISSVIQQAKTGAPLPSSNPFINFVSAQQAMGPQLLDPTKLNLTTLYAVSKKAIGPLKKIADNETDGVIPADDFDVNFNLSFLLVIRAVCGVLDTDGDGYPAETILTKNGNTVDIIGVNGSFELVNPDTSASIFDAAGELTAAFKTKFVEYTTLLKDVLKQRLADAITDIKLVVAETSSGRPGGYLKVALDKISPESAKKLEDNSADLKLNLENAKTKIAEL